MACCQDTAENLRGVQRGGVPRIIVSTEPITSPITSLKYAYSGEQPITFHSDGGIEYPAGAKTPKAMNGFEQDAANPSLFRPKWQPCIFRMFGLKGPKKDGTIDVVAICNEPDAKGFGTNVTHVDHCQGCPLRKEQ